MVWEERGREASPYPDWASWVYGEPNKFGRRDSPAHAETPDDIVQVLNHVALDYALTPQGRLPAVHFQLTHTPQAIMLASSPRVV